MGVWRRIADAASVLSYPLHIGDYLGLLDPAASGKQLRGEVTRVTHETPDSATIHFRPGASWLRHQAGQWARIGVEIDGVRHWRSYSLSSRAGDDPAITVTAIGLVSEALVRNTKPGDVLYLGAPEGDFVLPEHPRPLLLLTAGSGITPVMSMVRTLLAGRDDADVVLVHSARTRADSLFADELDALAAAHPRALVHHLWLTAERGRLDLSSPHELDALAPDWRGRASYAAGPADFVAAAERLWAASDTEHPLVIERFTPVTFEGPPGEGGRVTFTRSDKEVDADGATPLLHVGEDAGVAMPSGCRMGICRTCLTHLGAGRVRNLTTGVVSGEPGDLIQTCVSAAAGDVQLDL